MYLITKLYFVVRAIQVNAFIHRIKDGITAYNYRGVGCLNFKFNTIHY